ncbi:hypothetical protein EDF58_10970 [Novosphingobium sp. PhB57]|uniref:hypothetical protein n=1 Tax=Novosphingobium sp. PhB57 TaxID=2485107 RepID=UPI0010D427FE|nr:hypothetical protein [Novosphingobium sp. PhB57]TCU54487.1 hypothetical protein EDF58_10970 [Novosphingobium sp. PhB57]
MTDDELIDHAQRLYDLAASRVGSRLDLIHLRDLVPDLLDRLRSRNEPDHEGEGTRSF